MKEVNLWECITACCVNQDRERRDFPLAALGAEIHKEDLRNFAKSARWGGQELSLTATEEGWLIKIFSCYDKHNHGIEILIPKTGEPIKIVEKT